MLACAYGPRSLETGEEGSQFQGWAGLYCEFLSRKTCGARRGGWCNTSKGVKQHEVGNVNSKRWGEEEKASATGQGAKDMGERGGP